MLQIDYTILKNKYDSLELRYDEAVATNESLAKRLTKALDLAERASASRMSAIEQIEMLQDEVQSLKQQVKILEETRDLLRDNAQIN